ncbi:MAG: hypothetical protein LBC02_04695, partial [Planctomycetaceae bacterium]|nr:hypothetical protein [Planctomycetaceae bacterium]
MKRITYFILSNLTILGFCAVIVLTNRSFLCGQIVQMGGLPISDTTSIHQSVYNSNTPQTPIRQIQYLFPSASENEPVEPIPLSTHQSGIATMTRRSNLVVPLPPSMDTIPETAAPAAAVPTAAVPAATHFPAATTSVSAQKPIFGRYSLPQPLPSSTPSPFLLASHPQETDEAPKIQFSAPVVSETTAVKPIPTVSTVPPTATFPTETIPAATVPVEAVPAPTVPAATVPAIPAETDSSVPTVAFPTAAFPAETFPTETVTA